MLCGLTRSASRSWGSISEMVSSARPGCISVARSSFLLARESRSDRRMCAETITQGPKEISCSNERPLHLQQKSCAMAQV